MPIREIIKDDQKIFYFTLDRMKTMTLIPVFAVEMVTNERTRRDQSGDGILPSEEVDLFVFGYVDGVNRSVVINER